MSCCNCGCVAIDECSLYDLTPLKAAMKVFEKKSCVINAHEINLKQAMGDDCYKALCIAISEASNDLAAVAEPWKGVIESYPFKIMLAWWVYYRWLDEYGESQASESGLVEYDNSSQDGSKTASGTKFLKKLNSAKSNAEYYTEQWKKNCDLNFCKPQSCKEKCKPGLDMWEIERV